MSEIDWAARWQEGKIGFHRSSFNEYLIRYWPTLKAATGSEVLVPLCGKTLDLLWLTEQGHKVCGTEMVPMAIKAFFSENHQLPKIAEKDGYRCWQADSTSILEADFFNLPGGCSNSRFFYDRAALVALPEALRSGYVEQMMRIAPDLQGGLLVSFEYNSNSLQGPPFSVDQKEVVEHYSRWFEIELLADTETEPATSLKEQVKGGEVFREKAYRLSRL